MMFYRGLLNLFGYPSEWVPVFPHLPILGELLNMPTYWERWMLGPIFMVGFFGIVLMWKNLKIGWWIFTVLNFLVGYWFIFILEDIWQHHVWPHIVFSAVFLPFYPEMKRTGWLAQIFKNLFSPVVQFAIGLSQRPFVGRIVEGIPFLHTWINKLIINRIVGQARFRPHAFSTRSDFSSWASLTDRTWAGRHLGVSSLDQDSLPLWEAPNGLKPLFERTRDGQRLCPKSTVLFPAFAQYLTDGFLRTEPERSRKYPHGLNRENRKRTSSNHEIDLCTLYGLNETHTKALRVKSPTHDERGHLRSQILHGEEYPPFLFKGGTIDPEFEDLDTPLGLTKLLEAIDSGEPQLAKVAKEKLATLFAVGGDRVNTVPQVALINTLWLREHNRLARALGGKNPHWDDEQVFQTARNIVIAQFIKIVIEDYINHIAPISMDLLADPSVAWDAPWNKPNWITTEFSLLYRWHSLVPDNIVWGGQQLAFGPPYLMNNQPLLANGLKRGFEDLSAQPAAELGPLNTHPELLDFEWDSIQQGRLCKLQSYNDYREYLNRPPAKDFDDISGNPTVSDALKGAYGEGNIKNVDFFVGIFCEDRQTNSPLPETILGFVALDAFSQALTNPLLSKNLIEGPTDYKLDHPTYTNYGIEQIKKCKNLSEIVKRNIADPETLGFVSMTQAHWRPVKPE